MRVKYRDLEALVYRLQLTYDEIIDISDVIYLAGSTTGYTLPPDVYKITGNNLMLRSLLPVKLKVNITIDDIRLKSNLNNNKTNKFTKFFLSFILGLMESHWGTLGDTPGFVQLISGKYKSDKPINITGIDKIHLKSDLLMVVLLMVSENQFYTLLFLVLHQVIKKLNNLESNFSKRQTNLFYLIRFHLQDDDHKTVDLDNKTISFTCKLIKIY